MAFSQVTTVEQWELKHLLRKEQKIHTQMFKHHDSKEITILQEKHERLMARIKEKLAK